MFWIGGVWDKRIQHKVVGFTGLMLLYLVGHIAVVASGAPFLNRVILF